VFVRESEILRGFRRRGVNDFEALEAATFFQRALSEGDLVGTERVAAPDALGADWPLVVRHPRLQVISYPYEWTFSMLRDAALLQLRLTRQALAEQLITKDATPYNVQFEGSRPVFIDIGSFEMLESGLPWFGYRQFCTMFLNPLLLRARRDLPFQPWLRGSMEGIPPQAMVRLLGRRDRWRPGTFTHVTLHARLERRNEATERNVISELGRAGYGPALIDAQLRKLTRVVERLRWEPAKSTWSGYSDRSHYEDTDLAAKEAFVESVVGRTRRRLVWDLGANDGHFSRIASRHAEAVIAVDVDELVVDRLYRRLSEEGNSTITPLVMDLIDASPSQGWRGTERPAFFVRTRPDIVLALALVHHLAIPGTVPPEQITDWLVSLDTEIVLEVPHEDDPMVRRLLSRKRSDLFTNYQLETFDRLLSDRFDVRRRETQPSGTRTMYHLAPR
jgi:hypothetical protein